MPARPPLTERALWVLLFLGGFLVLALTLSAQAHADCPANRPAASAPVHHDVLAASSGRSAGPIVGAGRAQAHRDVLSTVAAATVRGTDRSVTGLLGTVRGVTRQVTLPVSGVAGTTGSGHRGSGHRTTGRRAPATRTPRPGHGARHTAASSGASGHQAGVPAGATRTGRDSGATPSRAPRHLPTSATFHERPAESDGGTRHTGTPHAVLFAGVTRGRPGAGATAAEHEPAPPRRASDVSVNPD